MARIVRAARQAGATEVELRIGKATVLVRIAPSTGETATPIEPSTRIVL